MDLASTAKEVVVCFYMLIDSSTSSRNGVFLDTGSFLHAFTRFTSRRGVPKDMTGDNDTTELR